MTLHIMGAGAMGCLWAAHLHCSAAHHKIVFVDSRLKKVYQPSQKLSFSVSSPFLPHIPDNTDLCFELFDTSKAELINCIFVCTKSFDALNGLQNLGKVIREQTVIVLFQNGLGSQYDIIKAFPKNPIYAAVTTEGANKSSPGHIIHAGKGITKIGPLNEPAEVKATYQNLLSVLQSNTPKQTIDLVYEENIMKALWHKLVINCAINPYTALLNCSNGKVNKSKLFKNQWPDLRRELSDLLKAAQHPISEAEIEKSVFEVMHKTQNNISSMLQDVRAGKRTEIEDINGFANRFLASHKLGNSINSELEERVLQLSVTN